MNASYLFLLPVYEVLTFTQKTFSCPITLHDLVVFVQPYLPQPINSLYTNNNQNDIKLKTEHKIFQHFHLIYLYI